LREDPSDQRRINPGSRSTLPGTEVEQLGLLENSIPKNTVVELFLMKLSYST